MWYLWVGNESNRLLRYDSTFRQFFQSLYMHFNCCINLRDTINHGKSNKYARKWIIYMYKYGSLCIKLATKFQLSLYYHFWRFDKSWVKIQTLYYISITDLTYIIRSIIIEIRWSENIFKNVIKLKKIKFKRGGKLVTDLINIWKSYCSQSHLSNASLSSRKE